MKNRKSFFIFFGLYYFLAFNQFPQMEFVSIDCPEEIVFYENTDLKKINIRYNINIKYLGEDIVYDNKILKCNPASYSKGLIASGEIYYIDNEGKILPEALKHLFKNNINLGGWDLTGAYYGGYDKFTIFKKDEIFSGPFILVDSWVLSDETDIDEAIIAKKLTTIVIIIKKVEANWIVTGCKINPSGKIELMVNRIKIIHVRYENKADSNPGSEK
jgi:hypothetical protein